mmetsp:Transcript_27991/g.73825  ORF Transcript_27991/g.73825 Transcript_27991/m.73825 type:complete len:299 (-) Transcript_27991:141-1037(-)
MDAPHGMGHDMSEELVGDPELLRMTILQTTEQISATTEFRNNTNFWSREHLDHFDHVWVRQVANLVEILTVCRVLVLLHHNLPARRPLRREVGHSHGTSTETLPKSVLGVKALQIRVNQVTELQALHTCEGPPNQSSEGRREFGLLDDTVVIDVVTVKELTHVAFIWRSKLQLGMNGPTELGVLAILKPSVAIAIKLIKVAKGNLLDFFFGSISKQILKILRLLSRVAPQICNLAHCPRTLRKFRLNMHNLRPLFVHVNPHIWLHCNLDATVCVHCRDFGRVESLRRRGPILNCIAHL